MHLDFGVTRALLAASALLVSVVVMSQTARAQNVLIEITAIVEHPALDATRQGVIEALEAAGYKQGQNLKIVYENAQGNTSTAVQIARKFVGDKPDVIVPISTASSQAVAAATKDIPIIFATVTDPIGAKLVASWEKPGGNITGVADAPPLDKHIALMKQITPNAKRIGVPYNPGESNSISQIKELKPKFEAAGLTMVEVTGSKSSDVLAAAQSLVGKVDAIFVPNDNTFVSALESVLKVGIDNKIPVYAGDTDSVKRGAIATVGFNYIDVGKQAGQMVLKVLKGEKPADIPVEGVKGSDLYVNPTSAAKMGVEIPKELISQAKQVF
jgi:putative tryptophan/tyrosine transport system substrate-binding protein